MFLVKVHCWDDTKVVHWRITIERIKQQFFRSLGILLGNTVILFAVIYRKYKSLVQTLEQCSWTYQSATNMISVSTKNALGMLNSLNDMLPEFYKRSLHFCLYFMTESREDKISRNKASKLNWTPFIWLWSYKNSWILLSCKLQFWLRVYTVCRYQSSV